jgi:hypothetical protein
LFRIRRAAPGAILKAFGENLGEGRDHGRIDHPALGKRADDRKILKHRRRSDQSEQLRGLVTHFHRLG